MRVFPRWPPLFAGNNSPGAMHKLESVGVVRDASGWSVCFVASRFSHRMLLSAPPLITPGRAPRHGTRSVHAGADAVRRQYQFSYPVSHHHHHHRPVLDPAVLPGALCPVRGQGLGICLLVLGEDLCPELCAGGGVRDHHEFSVRHQLARVKERAGNAENHSRLPTH